MYDKVARWTLYICDIIKLCIDSILFTKDSFIDNGVDQISIYTNAVQCTALTVGSIITMRTIDVLGWWQGSIQLVLNVHEICNCFIQVMYNVVVSYPLRHVIFKS